MDTTKQPYININNIILTELNFIKYPVSIPLDSKIDAAITFDIKPQFSKDKNILYLSFTVFINKEKKETTEFSLKCSVLGIFEKDKNCENMSLEEFCKNNAPAILYPYIREIISNTTLKAGYPYPIILPPCNFKAYMRNNSK